MNHLADRSKVAKRPHRADKVRLLVFEILTEVNHREGYSNLLLPEALRKSDFDPRDRAFATELLYGTLRLQGRHDFLLKQVIDRPLGELNSGIVDVARMGIHQIFEMRVPTHAAVSESVELARKVLGESKASYVNAILRKLASSPLEDWLAPVEKKEDVISKLAIKHSHPEWIVSAYYDLLKDVNEVERELSSNNQPAKPTYVTWPGKSSPADFAALGGKPTSFSPYGALLDEVPTNVSLIKSRKAGVQDEGSQILALAFSRAAIDKEPWLDLCAGPGGKAALLSHLSHERFFANEISSIRADLVRKVVSDNSEVIVGDGRDIKVEVNSVLADVPCTGLGALRRRPEVRWRRKPSDLPELTKLQFELASHAIELIPTGGIFGYATCSPHMAETAAQCATFEKKFAIEKLDVTPFLPSNLENGVRNGYMQLWPHRHNTDAMFLALYRKR